MRPPSEKIWIILMAVTATAAGVSAAAAAVSAVDGDMIQLLFSVISTVLFVLCLISANMIRVKISRMDRAEEEVSCLRLKKPGIEKRYEEEIVPKTPYGGSQSINDRDCDEEIVPKGKMPKE
ncbi:MAG: hypothetical protein LBP82_01590 [Candidatus Methanoplasma sp.]|jgi:hypothetical protein|nr:hypothetical protein [Candidatus Methanoplasma sp.]